MTWDAKELCVIPESRFLQPSESLLDGEEKQHIVTTMCEIFHIQAKRLRFPGGQPHSIRRHEMRNLKDGYYAALKSDGVRFMLLLTRHADRHVAVMIDRLMNVYEIEIWANSSFFNGTLFDGELVWDYGNTPPTITYLIFDIFCAKGKSLLNATYEDRILEANRWVITNIPHFMKDEDLDAYIVDEDKIYACNNYHSLKLCVKKVLPIEQLANVWEDRHKVNHMNDGIVFTKNGTVTPNYDVYKWKPENTIDILFSVAAQTTSDSPVDIYIRDGNKIALYEHLRIGETCYKLEICENIMIQYIANSEGTEESDRVEFVAECACNVDEENQIIKIFPVKRRNDKTSPNNITTVVETIHNIIENVQISEFYDVLSDSFEENLSTNTKQVPDVDESTRKKQVVTRTTRTQKRKQLPK